MTGCHDLKGRYWISMGVLIAIAPTISTTHRDQKYREAFRSCIMEQKD